MKLSQLFYNCAYTAPYVQAGDSVNYAFVEEGTTLYIYFQGSNSITDWVRNFLFGKKPYKDMETPYRVHRGFLAAWKEVENIIITKIKDPKWTKIITVGYSHGGALAGLCHECVWYWRPDLRDVIEGYGFEAPRFYAGYRVKPELRERWARFVVIRDNNDIVTHCPPSIFGYCHVGQILKVHGNVSLAPKKWYIPRCVKSHYPEVVYNGLVEYERSRD